MKSNRVLIIVLIVLLSLITLSLLGIMIVGITGNLPSLDEKINSKYELALSENLIRKCDFVIESEDCDLNVLTYNGDFYGNIQIYNNKECANIKFEDGVCKISSKLKTAPINFNFKTPVIDLYLPADYSGKISVNCDSGDVNTDNFKNLVLSVNSDSGDITAGVIKNAVLNTDLGDIKIKEVNSLNADSDSGNINAGTVSSFLNITSDSGDVVIEQANLTAESSVKTDSGNINIVKTNDIYIDANAHYGDMSVGNTDRKADFALILTSESGNIKANY